MTHMSPKKKQDCLNDLCDHDVELDWLRLCGFGLPSSSISAVQDYVEKLAGLLTLWGSNLFRLAGCNFQALGTEATVCHGSQLGSQLG